MNWLRTPLLLVADDSMINQKIVKAFLVACDCAVDLADNGIAAVEKYKNGNYDLVYMDVNMPGMDGLEATGKIREWEKANNRPATPIVALTASLFAEEHGKCEAAGMSGFLSKPVINNDLKNSLNKFLIHLADDKFVPAVSLDDVPPPYLAVPAEIPVLSREKALAALEIKESFYNELLEIFLRTLPEPFNRLKIAIAEKKCADAAMAAHLIRGQAAMVRAERLAMIAAAIEKAGWQGDTEALLCHFPVMEREIQAVMALKN